MLSSFRLAVFAGLSAFVIAINGCASDRGPGSTGDGGMSGGDGGTPAGDASIGTSELVSPTCIDGQYTEVLPTGSEAIADLTFTATDLVGSALLFLDRRYPNGADIVSGCLEHDTEARCVNMWFQPAPTTTSEFLLGLSTVVHEAGHLNDLGRGGSGFGTYFYTSDTILSCDDGDSVPRGGQTFARSEIYDDAFQSEFPACASFSDRDCDSYALIYLDPNSPVGTLGPSQGFSSVIEEATQYVNSLATGFAFRDQLTGQRSERDGILAYLWYVERYLHLARLEQPDVYNFISSSACWREVILTLWGRAWLYLQHTTGHTELEINAPTFLQAVQNPVLVDEIARIRALQGCS
ncbi:MAG: hypothetical protein IPK60_00820 [Sandaracinaceae bacterium]|nr:hypothetical protein [Sandaracinaceae bacterium]